MASYSAPSPVTYTHGNPILDAVQKFKVENEMMDFGGSGCSPTPEQPGVASGTPPDQEYLYQSLVAAELISIREQYLQCLSQEKEQEVGTLMEINGDDDTAKLTMENALQSCFWALLAIEKKSHNCVENWLRADLSSLPHRFSAFGSPNPLDLQACPGCEIFISTASGMPNSSPTRLRSLAFLHHHISQKVHEVSENVGVNESAENANFLASLTNDVFDSTAVKKTSTVGSPLTSMPPTTRAAPSADSIPAISNPMEGSSHSCEYPNPTMEFLTEPSRGYTPATTATSTACASPSPTVGLTWSNTEATNSPNGLLTPPLNGYEDFSIPGGYKRDRGFPYLNLNGNLFGKEDCQDEMVFSPNAVQFDSSPGLFASLSSPVVPPIEVDHHQIEDGDSEEESDDSEDEDDDYDPLYEWENFVQGVNQNKTNRKTTRGKRISRTENDAGSDNDSRQDYGAGQSGRNSLADLEEEDRTRAIFNGVIELLPDPSVRITFDPATSALTTTPCDPNEAFRSSVTPTLGFYPYLTTNRGVIEERERLIQGKILLVLFIASRHNYYVMETVSPPADSTEPRFHSSQPSFWINPQLFPTSPALSSFPDDGSGSSENTCMSSPAVEIDDFLFLANKIYRSIVTTRG